MVPRVRRVRTVVRNAGHPVACSKQITRDLLKDHFTSDNHFKQHEIESLSFRFTNPRSTKSIRCQTASTLAGSKARASQRKSNVGRGCRDERLTASFRLRAAPKCRGTYSTNPLRR